MRVRKNLNFETDKLPPSTLIKMVDDKESVYKNIDEKN